MNIIKKIFSKKPKNNDFITVLNPKIIETMEYIEQNSEAIKSLKNNNDYDDSYMNFIIDEIQKTKIFNEEKLKNELKNYQQYSKPIKIKEELKSASLFSEYIFSANN